VFCVVLLFFVKLDVMPPIRWPNSETPQRRGNAQGGGLRLGLATAGVMLAISAAQAQVVAPSQVTPSELKPARSGSTAIALPESQGLIPPPNSANLSVTLGGVVVQGGFEDLAAKTDEITAGLAGRRVSVAEIYAAASALEGAYGSAGYALVRVVVPPQTLDPRSRLKIIVVDGFVDSLDLKGVPERQRGVVSARLAPLIGKRHIKLTEIERRVLLAGDVPGLALKSTLAAGAASGGAKLILNATDKLLTGSSGVDNDLPRALRNWELTRSLQINSPFGLGEQFYFSAITGYDALKLFDGTIPLQIFGGGLVMPVGVDGLTINPEYTNAITRPLPPAGAPKVTGYFQRADLRASYPVIRTRKLTLIVSSTLEWDQEYMTDGFGPDLYSDEYGVWRGKADSQFSLNGGASLETAGALSQGLGGRTGVGSLTPLSQQGATPTFTKFNVNGQFTQPLPNLFSLALFGAGQTSFGKPLMVSEQFSLDGPSAVSGFPTGTFVVDEGAFGRAEFGRTFPLTAFGAQIPVEPYVFGAGGFGVIDMPTAVQQRDVRVGSLGVGARAGVSAPAGWWVSGADVAAEVARFASDVPGEREGWRGNFSFSVRF
jgi:hemolysin activation/secretion protein